MPNRRSAVSHWARVPGTPTPSPLVTASSNGIALPVAGSTKESSRIARGAVSRPSTVYTLRRRAS